jgi:hypothetical protein
MGMGDPGPTFRRAGREPAVIDGEPPSRANGADRPGPGSVLVTVVNPFHCLYLDAI